MTEIEHARVATPSSSAEAERFKADAHDWQLLDRSDLIDAVLEWKDAQK